jgi:hypothetical protein
MRYNQIIVEYLDLNVYGSWIDSKTGETFPIIEPMGHSKWLRENINKIPQFKPYANDVISKINALTSEEQDEWEDEKILYDMAYNAGFIKSMHPNRYNDFNIVLGGKKTDLARSMKYVWNDLKHAVGKLYLYVYTGLDNDNEVIFKLPSQLSDIRKYLKEI